VSINLVSIGNDGLVRVKVRGELTSEHLKAEQGDNPLKEILGQQWATNQVLIDFGEARYLDSAALGWLMSSQKEFQKSGGMMVVHSVPPRVRQMFDLLKLETIVPMAPNEAEAVEIAKGGEA
jgi:anti-anti-sigma factor